MRFNSLIYLAFLAVVVAVLWAIPQRARRGWLLAVSYAFYASWHWPFVILLFGVATFTWASSHWIVKASDRQKRGAAVIAANLLVLGAFKYTDWATTNVNALARLLHLPATLSPPHWLLPLGVSFYVFECVSYVVDLVRKREKVHSFFSFHLYLAFFPHLVAGPILRAKELLPQIDKPKPFDSNRFFDGLRMIVTGIALKTLLADIITPDIDAAFARKTDTLGATDVVIMAAAFGMQIYFDFSSYSRIAIGSAKLCGVELVENFNFPYVAHSPSDFWNRWHMSLSRWIRDYLFYPLTKGSTALFNLCAAALISMTLCGLWHGAGWTFVVWGLYHGVLIAAYHIATYRSRPKAGDAQAKPPQPASKPVRALQIALTFGLICIGWIFFRAATLSQASEMLLHLFTPWAHRHRVLPGSFYLHTALLVALVWSAPWLSARADALSKRLRGNDGERPAFAWWAVEGLSIGVLSAITLIYLHGQTAFIYFQF